MQNFNKSSIYGTCPCRSGGRGFNGCFAIADKNGFKKRKQKLTMYINLATKNTPHFLQFYKIGLH
jgi:hypothetical protein